MNMGIIAASRLRAPVNTNAFIIEVDTTKAGTPSDQFQFTGAEGDYDVVAKQGGSVVQTFTNLSDEETITFSGGGGIYDLEITPKATNGFDRIRFINVGDKLKITDIKQWGTIVWTSFNSSFRGCSNMEVNASDAPNLSICTSLLRMFRGCNSLNQSLNHWDVTNIMLFNDMFRETLIFNQPLNDWRFTNGATLFKMFQDAKKFNQPLNDWNTENIDVNNGFRETFSGAIEYNQDLSSWCVENRPDRPIGFDDNTPNWVLPKPNWGAAC
jgi:hypothetical protein